MKLGRTRSLRSRRQFADLVLASFSSMFREFVWGLDARISRISVDKLGDCHGRRSGSFLLFSTRNSTLTIVIIYGSGRNKWGDLNRLGSIETLQRGVFQITSL